MNQQPPHPLIWQIIQEIAIYRSSQYKKPARIYLGHEHYREVLRLERHCNDGIRTKFQGLDVFLVDDDFHICVV